MALRHPILIFGSRSRHLRLPGLLSYALAPRKKIHHPEKLNARILDIDFLRLLCVALIYSRYSNEDFLNSEVMEVLWVNPGILR